MKKILLFSCIAIGLFFITPYVNACDVIPPKIDSYFPKEIIPGETVLTINGSNFNDDIQDSAVQFDAYSKGTIISWSNNQISVRAPSPLYLGNFRVSICCGWQCNSSVFYDIALKPKISYLSANSITPGEKLVINGNNFGSNQGRVYLDGQQVDITQWSLVSTTVIIPNLDSGNVDVEVETSKGAKSDPISLKIIPPCNVDTWSCGNWTTCSSNGSQTRSCIKTNDCATADTPSPITIQSCTPPVPTCTQDAWTCSEWGNCSPQGIQARNCNKILNCQGGVLAPASTQNCSYTPPCFADSWTCGEWSYCSLSGIQNRSCTKAFDCPNVQTAPPITDQYCEASNRQTPQTPPIGSDKITNQDLIIKSTVKLICPVDENKASQGSGTIIDPNGTILTNKHVIAGTLGCLVGFIDNFNDEPYFGEKHIADILKTSPTQDIAILKIRNPQNRKLSSINITEGNITLQLGEKITTYGYPAKFGENITYTSGDFSGKDGSYFKTTAILEYGNSGGGAYQKNGTFIGIPSAVVKGELNSMGYILSINAIKNWIGNIASISGEPTNNRYSRVSVLEDIDQNKLGSLKLFIPETDAKGDLTNQEQLGRSQAQEESNIIESTDQNQQDESDQNQTSPDKGQKQKISWFKRAINWITTPFRWFINLFK